MKSPHEFDARALQLIDLLKEFMGDYRWAHNAAFAKVKGDAVRRSSGPSDPTGDAAVMTRLRSACAAAGRRLDDALGKIDSAQVILESAMASADPARRSEPVGPRTATLADLEVSRAAKKRREDRGEGWGNG